MKNPGKRLLQRPNPPICDNSNDSGLGFEHHQELPGGATSAYHAQLAIGNGATSHHRQTTQTGTSLNTTNR